jgi:transposase
MGVSYCYQFETKRNITSFPHDASFACTSIDRKGHSMNKFIRLTTGQAIVRFIARQFVSGEKTTRKTRESYEKAAKNQRPVFA